MSLDEQEPIEVNSMMENIMVQFNASIKAQEELNLQLSHRTSQITRYGIFMLILLFCSIAFLTWSLKQDMGAMSLHMEEMAKDAATMSNAIGQMQSNMSRSVGLMQNSMSNVEAGINQIVLQTQFSDDSTVQSKGSVDVLSNIAGSVQLMQNDISSLNKSIGNLNYNLTTINKQMKSLNRSLRSMSQDVNRMPSPANMFPF